MDSLRESDEEQAPFLTILTRLRQQWQRLTEPPESIIDPEARFRLRILLIACVLSAVMVPLILYMVYSGNSMFLAPSVMTWCGISLTVWLARSRYVRYASAVATIFCIAILFPQIALTPVPPIVRSFFVLVPLLMYSLIWSVRVTILLTIIHIGGAVLLSGIETSQPELITISLAFLVFSTAFILLGAVVREYTFRTLAQRTQELERSEARFRGAIEGSLDAFYYLTGLHDERGELIDFTVTIANQRGLDLLTNPPPNLIGTRVSTILNAMGYLRSLDKYIEVVQSKKSYEEEFLAPTAFKAKWLHLEVVPVADNLALTCRDITERKEAEALLIQREREFRTLAENLPNQIGRIARDGSILYMNPPLATTFSSVGKPTTPKRLEDFPLIPSAMRQQAIDGLTLVFERGEPIRYEFHNTINGQEAIFSARLVPEKDENGQVKTALGIVRNITESRRAEHQRIDLALERERMRLLRQFVSDVSHDLMTPLTVIKNSLYLMRRLNDTSGTTEYTEQISTQTDYLEKMIRDMLLLSQLDDAGQEDFHFSSTDLNAFVGSFIQEHQALIAKKNQRLGFEASPTPIRLPIDKDKLWRVLTNLVHNAVKYTPEDGSITVSIKQMDATHACIDIHDTGMGIPASDLPHVFERFFKGSTHRPNEGGSGLGLSIAQRIVEAHHGSLAVESEVGTGTTFHILLPIGETIPLQV